MSSQILTEILDKKHHECGQDLIKLIQYIDPCQTSKFEVRYMVFLCSDNLFELCGVFTHFSHLNWVTPNLLRFFKAVPDFFLGLTC